MSAYREFTGKTVEEALREAREAFGVGLDGLTQRGQELGQRGGDAIPVRNLRRAHRVAHEVEARRAERSM